MKRVVLVMLLAFEIFTIGNVYSKSVTDEISQELLRMHILANSNNELDQNVKIEIRDFVLDYVDKKDLKTKKDVINNVCDIESEINSYLFENKIGYRARVTIGYSPFLTKEYNDIAIPKGVYNSLKIILGKGEGENWWCVAYPPLCFTEAVSGKISDEGEYELKNTLNSETYNLMKRDKVEYKIKFKSVEIFNSILKNH